MKKILLATTMIVAGASMAAAEVQISGSAGMGLQYSANVGANVAKTNALSYVTLTFGGSVETDNGLALSASTAYKVTNNGTIANDDTTVSISGAFGKISMGAVDEADVQGGLADIGFDGIGIDNLAESLDGGVSHNVNYTFAAGAVSVSLSADVGGVGIVADTTSGATPTTKNDSYAVGAKYNFGNGYVGLGYHSKDTFAGAADVRDGDTTSIYAGATVSGVSINAMYSSFDPETTAAKTSAYGVNVAYTMDATTVSFGYSDADTNTVNEKAIYGLGVAYDLGGGATLKGGVGKVRSTASAAATKTVADFGVSFSF